MKKLIVKYLRRLQWRIEAWCDRNEDWGYRPCDDPMIQREVDRMVPKLVLNLANASPWAEMMK